MAIDLRLTEDNILAKLEPLCEDFNFQRYAHPGSLATLGFPINKVTALLRFLEESEQMPANMNAPCANTIVNVNFELHLVYIDYRGHHKIYDLSCSILQELNHRRDLLVFKPGCKNTEHYSFVHGPKFLEVDNDDHACFSYRLDLNLRYSNTTFRRL